MTSANWTNVWLGVIAVLALVQLALIGLLVSVLARVSARVSGTLDLIDRVVPPLAERASARLDEVESLVANLSHTESMVRAGVERAAQIWTRAGDELSVRLWPVVGFVRGLRAAARVWARSSKTPRAPRPPQDAVDEARFVYESGHTGDAG